MKRVSERLPIDPRYPWAWCNLQQNPFGELTRSQRIELAVVDLPGWLSALPDDFPMFPQSHMAIQWLAQCGFGKSTRLLAATKWFPEAYYVYVDPMGKCGPIPEAKLLLLDEADRMPRPILKSILRLGTPLMLGVHRSLKRLLTQWNYRVQTHSLQSENEATQLARIMNTRLRHFRLDADRVVPQLTKDESQWLSRRFGGDMRAVEDYLYDQVQTQRDGSHDGRLQFIDSPG